MGENPKTSYLRRGGGVQSSSAIYSSTRLRCQARYANACRNCRRRFLPLMTPRARRALFTLILFFAACAVTGSILQHKVRAQSSEDESQLRDNLKAFTTVYALV